MSVAPIRPERLKTLQEEPDGYIYDNRHHSLMMWIIEVNAGGRGVGMRLTNEKVAENKARVVEAAARLFREKGFEGVAVADLMHAAGLTHGGFYNHFESKDELAAQACTQIFEGPVAAMERIAAIESASGRTAALDAYKRRYLSGRSRDAPAAHCPMVALGTDVSRHHGAVVQAYAVGLRRYLDAFTRALRGAKASRQKAAREQSIATMAMLAGALSLARSVAEADPELSDEILTSAFARLPEATR
jgi:TetR/AcrR family transcriptional regulator, transcriptional repressor for nem operon